MFYAISWFLSFFLLALWSLTCWGLHAVTVWAISSAGVMAGGASAVNAVLVPDWLRGWIPPELAREFGAMIASAGPMVQSALEAVPALSGAVTVLAWGIWGLGAVVLVALAIGAHGLIALLQRRRAGLNAPHAAVVR
ncbi:hypothetical protein [Acidovorax sp. NCPPB 3576]|uniref:hypothetical protein n=1 Tax=Acidovorax sp. NCPPB 3576 TaxID=2940488 RepID=UPI0023493254|nr:hypothetical protein [Acidovorax sp. NCPPB 3576]WCM87031.1 hypothetical protein M5C98_16870 [Acidovorax sp. NCPPB 3576]